MIIRLLLLVFPRRFREAHAGDLVALYHDFDRAGRGAGRLAVARDLLRNGIGARLDDWRDPGLPHRPRLPGKRKIGMDLFWSDVRFAVRTLLRSPVFTAVAVISLAIGIGASTAVFSLADAALMRPLPVEDADRLIILGWRGPAGEKLPGFRVSGWYLRDEAGDGLSSSFSPPAYEAIRARNSVLATTFGFAEVRRLNVSIDGEADLVSGQIVTGNYYGALGLSPAVGRLIVEDDDRADAEAVAVLSYGYWQRRFGGSADAVGKVMTINGRSFTIVGVAPRGFAGTGQIGTHPEVTTAIAKQELVTTRIVSMNDPAWWWMHILGRLEPGVDADAAQQNLNAIFQASVEADLFPDGVPEEIAIPTIDVRPGSHGMTERRGEVLQPLTTMGIVVGLVLVIACVNVANLLLARSGTRRREIAVRLSIGASRWRLIRQLLAESIVLAGVAGLLGVVLAAWGSGLLLGTMVSRELYLNGVEINAKVLAFSACVALLTGLLFGLAPALRASRPDLTPPLKDGQDESSARRGGLWVPKSLMAAQVAMSLLLLVATGLFVRTLANLEDEASGFDPRNVAMFSIDARLNGYDGVRQQSVYDEVQRRLSSLPGVEASTLGVHSPVSGSMSGTSLKIAGYTPREDEEMMTFVNIIGPEFFETFGIPLVRGRGITAEDREGTRMVGVINESFAERFFPNEDPIGRRFGLGGGGAADEYEIVGVARDVKYQVLRDRHRAAAHVSHAQHPGQLEAMTFAVRTRDDPLVAMAAFRDLVAGVDPDLPLYWPRTLEAQQLGTLEQERLFVRMSGFLGALALALASIGLYGILSYSVVRRTREIGVRMALGARTADVMRLVFQELRAVLLGVGVGLIAAIGLARFIESQLYELSKTDPATMVVATLVLILVAILAAFLPARRASAVDPIVALRFD